MFERKKKFLMKEFCFSTYEMMTGRVQVNEWKALDIKGAA